MNTITLNAMRSASEKLSEVLQILKDCECDGIHFFEALYFRSNISNLESLEAILKHLNKEIKNGTH